MLSVVGQKDRSTEAERRRATQWLPLRQGLTFRSPVPRHSLGLTQKPVFSGLSSLLAKTERGGVKRYAGIPFTSTSF